MVSKFRNILLLTGLVFALTACGGSSSTGVDTEKQEIAIKKITDYASDSHSNARPTKEDYINAGVENLSVIDVEELSNKISKLKAEDVDTLAELNALAKSLIDTTAPVITLKGKRDINVTFGTAYVELGATALDDKDGNVTVAVINANVNVAQIGVYTVRYKAEDKAGNKAEATRKVNVIDTTPPVITLNGAESTTVVKNEKYVELGAEAEDDVDGTLSVDISGEVDTTRANDYNITYRVSDTAGHEVTKTRTVHVILSVVGQLLEDAAQGSNLDVHYIVVGDSTRNYPFDIHNTILVDSYYPNQLNRIHVAFAHTALSGMEAYKWKENISNYDGKTKPRLQDTLDEIPLANHNNYIVEFSLGINDSYYKIATTKAELKTIIRSSIDILHGHRPNLKILMVSPVAYTLSDTSKITSEVEEEVYREVYSELIAEGATYLSFVSGRDATKAVPDCFSSSDTCKYYGDSIHPAEDGSLRLVNYIFSEIGGSSVHHNMTVSSADSPTHMSLDEMHVDLDIRLEER